MQNCNNCKYLISRDICCYCSLNGCGVDHPWLMGGKKRCECYEKNKKVKTKFVYPKWKEKGKK